MRLRRIKTGLIVELAQCKLSRRQLIRSLGAGAGLAICPAWAAEIGDIAPQPYFASVNRAIAALAGAGQPIDRKDATTLQTLASRHTADSVAQAEAILARYTLVRVELAPEMTGRAVAGGAPRTLIEQGWKVFLVRIANADALRGMHISRMSGRDFTACRSSVLRDAGERFHGMSVQSTRDGAHCA